MALEHFLSENKATILERWYRLIRETYPPNTARFLKREKNRFVNPVGYTISQEIGVLYDELLTGMDLEKLTTSLENIIKIRSVQDFSPSEGVVFIHLLKRTMREELEGKFSSDRIFEEWAQLESKIDTLALLAFDIYMRCREKIFEIKVREVKGERERIFKLLERTRLVSGDQGRE
jgi:hypothetical protein